MATNPPGTVILYLPAGAPVPTVNPGTVVTKGDKGEQGPQGPPGKDGGNARPPGVFSPLDFGAKRDGSDDTQAIQAALDAAFAHTDGDSTKFAAVDVAGDYWVVDPLYLDGSRVTVRGPGRLRSGGHLIAAGVNRLTPAEALARRPPAAALDATAQGRRALATLGTHTVTVSASPLQLGQTPGQSPDYWQQDVYTFESLPVRPDGVTWSDGATLWGAWDGGDPEPIVLDKKDGGFGVVVRTADQAPKQYHTLNVASADPGPAYGVCLQFDLKAGTVAAWVNGKPCPVSLPPEWKPGLKLAAPGGVRPWQLATHDGQVTDLRLEGHAVTAGAKYVPGSNPQARADGQPVTDHNRYFDDGPSVVAYLPLDDTPATHVTVRAAGRNGRGFWVENPSGRHRKPSAGDLAFENLGLTADSGSAITVGQAFGLRLSDCRLGGSLQAVGTLSFDCSYPVLVERCRLEGSHAPVVAYQQILTVRDSAFSAIGRHAFIFCGGGSTVENCLVTSVAGDTVSVLEYLGDGYGAHHRVTDLTVDIEFGSALKWVIGCGQHPYWHTLLMIDGLHLGVIDGGQRVLRLTGYGNDGGTWKPARVDLRNVVYWDGRPTAPVEVNGPGWSGVVDLWAFPSGTITGDGGAGITVIQPAGK